MPKLDLSFITADKLKKLKDHDIPLLCNLFVKLMKQLPEGQVVFCLIDGVSFYEINRLTNDFIVVVDALVALIGDKKLSAVVKLLFSAPRLSRYIPGRLDAEQIFRIFEDIEHTNQGFNSHSYGKKAQDRYRSLESEVRPESDWPTHSSEEEEDSEMSD